MDILVNKAITEILENRKDFLRLIVRQKNKFEGWLKFELAYYLEKAGMEAVEVEKRLGYSKDRYDISFFHNDNLYRVELKTANTNWNMPGIKQYGKPITKNIQSIIDDAKKLNSYQGILAFVLFPVPIGDHRWEMYIDRISKQSRIKIDKEKQCTIVKIAIDNTNYCNLMCALLNHEYFQIGIDLLLNT
jgi:hypothetical protein